MYTLEAIAMYVDPTGHDAVWLREIATKYGFEVKWDPKTKTATAVRNKDGREFNFNAPIFDGKMYIDDKNFLYTTGIESPNSFSDYMGASLKTAAITEDDLPNKSSNGTSNATTFTFNATSFPGFYDASNDKTSVYNIPAILKDTQNMWDSYGQLFKKVGAELDMDPYALATYCVFESYNSNTHNFNTRMKDFEGGMYAAGIAATQAQDVKGKKVPGLNVYLPNDTLKAAETLRDNPEYGIRYLAEEFKGYYSKEKDLAKVFPKVAFPSWGDPNKSRGNYGTQAQYVSRAYVFYNAFRSVDGK